MGPAIEHGMTAVLILIDLSSAAVSVLVGACSISVGTAYVDELCSNAG